MVQRCVGSTTTETQSIVRAAVLVSYRGFERKGDPVLGYVYVIGFVRKADHVLGHNIITAANPVKLLKDALALLGPYQTLTGVCGNDPGGKNSVSSPATIQI
jgi:hypothetical protein